MRRVLRIKSTGKILRAFDSSRLALMAMALFGFLSSVGVLAQDQTQDQAQDQAQDQGMPPPIDVWWSDVLAAPADEALDDALYQAFAIDLVHRESGKRASAADCFDAADLMERGYRPAPTNDAATGREAYLCFARRIMSGAQLASVSEFRNVDRAPELFDADYLMELPALVGPGGTCDYRALKQLTATDWISVARYFHIYIAGLKHDYQERKSIVDDPAAYTPQKLLVTQQGANQLLLTSVVGTVVLERLGLADVNRDGVEDMLVLRTIDDAAPQLFVLTKPSAESLISPLNRRDVFLDFAFACPAEAVTIVSREAEEGTCE